MGEPELTMVVSCCICVLLVLAGHHLMAHISLSYILLYTGIAHQLVSTVKQFVCLSRLGLRPATGH